MNILQDNLSNLAQQVLSSQMEKTEQNQFNNLFQTYFVAKKWHCRVIIDDESWNNHTSLELVKKLGLTTRPHPHPDYMQRVNSYDKIKVTEITLIEFFIGSDKDSVDFDIVPLQACQLLLGKPWISENLILLFWTKIFVLKIRNCFSLPLKKIN